MTDFETITACGESCVNKTEDHYVQTDETIQAAD